MSNKTLTFKPSFYGYRGGNPFVTAAKSAYQFQKKHGNQIRQLARIASDVAGENYYQAFLKTAAFPRTKKVYSRRTPYRVSRLFQQAKYPYRRTRTRYTNRRRRYGRYRRRKRVPYWIWLRNKRKYKRYSKKHY